VVFSWKLIHDQIPTKENLSKRNILALESPKHYVMCNGLGKRPTNYSCIMMSCAKYWWCGLDFILLRHWIYFFVGNVGAGKQGPIRLVSVFFLFGIQWFRWFEKRKNEMIFKDAIKLEEIVEEVKELSRLWSLSRINIMSCL